MAKIQGSLKRALLRYPDLDLSRLRIVGWGAGEFFREFYPLLSDLVNIEYTICPWEQNQGKEIHGIKVRPPEALAEEDPENTLILVFALDFSERISDITYGEWKDFPVMRAMEFNVRDVPLMEELEDRRQLMADMSMPRRLAPSPKVGIFVQGLAFEFTPQVLAWNRTRFPTAYQCMVTWEHQPKELLDKCRPWLDELILIPQPDNPRGDNANYILWSALKGVEHLKEKGVEFAVRCRSDNILIGGSIYQAIESLFSNGRNKGKIAIDLRSGWKYVPFHFSEKIMLARVEDMHRLWARELDARPVSELKALTPLDAHFQQLAQLSMESYLWRGYASELGYATETLVDSYHFAKERLMSLNTHIDWFSFKFIPLFNVERKNSLSFSQEDWEELFHDSDTAIQRAQDISSRNITIKDYWRRKLD